MNPTNLLDVIIVGGSYAGLSAGLVLGRSLRNVVIIDGGQPCNRQTPHSHSFLTRDGETPGQIAAIARQQLQHYPTVSLVNGTAVSARKKDGHFLVETETGEQFQSRKLLLATGVKDHLPAIPGFAECWGISVLHCPYCHGYEVHSQNLGVMGNGDVGFEFARLIHHWSKNLTLLTNGKSTLTAEQTEKLRQKNIAIVETELAGIGHENGYLQRVFFADDTYLELDAVFARVPFTQHSDLAAQLGCGMADTGLVQCDEFGVTNVAGVYVAGDASTFMRQVVMASANAAKAAAWINREMIEEDF